MHAERPRYSHAPIRSVQALCRALKVPEPLLRSLARRSSSLYIGPTQKPKKNGGVRNVYDTKEPLKSLLRRINRVIFEGVVFPRYLTGSIKKSDHVANVALHVGSKTAIKEDLAQFFDSITDSQVFDIWSRFFRFSSDVSSLLTALTTRDGKLFQGVPTSSYLANLVMWEKEAYLVARLAARNIRYSRFVDDITLSSREAMSPEAMSWAISQVYGVYESSGFKMQRIKHDVLHDHHPVTIMGLNANSPNVPTLGVKERSAVRAQVFLVERMAEVSLTGPELVGAISRASGKVGRVRRLHAVEGSRLHSRLAAVRESVQSRKATYQSEQENLSPQISEAAACDVPPPWDESDS